MISDSEASDVRRALRFRMLLVPIDIRKGWTDFQLWSWWLQVQPDFEKRSGARLSFVTLKTFSRGLVGGGASA